MHRRICFIKKQTLWNILAKTFQAFSQKLPNICIWQDSHFIKDLFLFFLSGRPTTTFEILRKAETWHSWHLLEFRMSSLSATKFWVYWRPSLQTCQFSAFLDLFLHWSPVAHWAPTDLERPSFSALSFCLCILFMGFSRQESWSDVPSILQWTTFCQNSPPWSIWLGWPYTAWLIVSLNWTSKKLLLSFWRKFWNTTQQRWILL